MQRLGNLGYRTSLLAINVGKKNAGKTSVTAIRCLSTTLSEADKKKLSGAEKLLEKLAEEERMERKIPHWSPTAPSDVRPSTAPVQPSKILFTPGPLTTSYYAKLAALHDYGSRDHKFIKIVKDVCEGLLDVAAVNKKDFTTVPIQGSGTFAIEGVLSSVIPKKKGVLIIANGAYGTRQRQICKVHNIAHTFMEFPENAAPNLDEIDKALQTNAKDHSHVAIVHSETTSGIINDIEAVGKIAHKHGKSYIVDAMPNSRFHLVSDSCQNGGRYRRFDPNSYRYENKSRCFGCI